MTPTSDRNVGDVMANPGPFVVSHACSRCSGNGTIGEQACSACYATGVAIFFHGTKADLNVDDRIEPGRSANFGEPGRTARHVYFSGTLDAAIWGAELARGEGRGRIYIVEPTGPIENDPNLTDKKFPGNPTRSFRSRAPLRITGEIASWQGHPPEQLDAMKKGLAERKRGDPAIIDD